MAAILPSRTIMVDALGGGFARLIKHLTGMNGGCVCGLRCEPPNNMATNNIARFMHAPPYVSTFKGYPKTTRTRLVARNSRFLWTLMKCRKAAGIRVRPVLRIAACVLAATRSSGHTTSIPIRSVQRHDLIVDECVSRLLVPTIDQ